MAQDGNVIFPENPGIDELEGGYREADTLEMTMEHMRNWDMGCIFHDTPDGNGRYQVAAEGVAGMGQYGNPNLESQIIMSAESPDGPSWGRNYMHD